MSDNKDCIDLRYLASFAQLRRLSDTKDSSSTLELLRGWCVLVILSLTHSKELSLLTVVFPDCGINQKNMEYEIRTKDEVALRTLVRSVIEKFVFFRNS